MPTSALSRVDPQVRVTVSHSDGPAIIRADHDSPSPLNPPQRGAVPPFPSPAVAGEGEGPGGRKGFTRNAPVEAVPPSPSPAVAGEGEGPGEREGFTNGLTHALTSQQAVIGGEDASAFEAYRTDLLAALEPEDQPENDLAETMVMSQWKLRRLWRQETECYAAIRHKYENPTMGPAVVFLLDCRAEQGLTRLSRHEAHLMRAYLRAESRLRLLQDLRRKGLREANEQPAASGARNSAPLHNNPIVSAIHTATDRVGAHCDAPSPSEPHPPPSPIPATHSNDAAIREIANRPAPAPQDALVAHGGAFSSPPPQLDMEKKEPAQREDAEREAPADEPNPQVIPISSTHRDDSRIGENTNRLPHAAD